MTNAEARFNKIHIRKVYACLAVTCHLHFWQNDRDFLRATVVTRGWNGYRNKSQHRKSTLEKKILPPFQQGFEPATFQSRVRCSNNWAIPAPTIWRWGRRRLYTCRYTVTTKMTRALKWAAMRAILMCHKLRETKSQDSVHRPLKSKESRSGFKPRPLRLTAGPNQLTQKNY